MQFSQALCQSLFSDLAETLSFSGATEFSFTQLRFWELPLEENCLYIARASELMNFSADVAETCLLNLFCVEDQPLPTELATCPNVNLTLFPAEVSIPALFNRMSRLLSQSRMGPGIQALIGMVARGESLSILVEHISHILSAPTAILSGGFKVIDSSTGRDTGFPLWDSILSQQFYPNFDLIQKLVSQLSTTPPRSKSFVFSFSKTPGYVEYFTPIIADNATQSLLGFLYFFLEDDQARPCDLDTIGLIASMLSWRLWRYTHQVKAGDVTLGLIITDILSGSLRDNSLIQSRLKKSHLKLSKNLFFIVVSTSSIADNSYTLNYLKQVFFPIWPDGSLITYTSDIIFLVRSEEPHLDPERLDAFTRLLRQYGCHAGISGPFHQVDTFIRHHYIRCLASARMAKQLSKESCFAWYDEIALFHFVHEGPPASSLREVCNPFFLQVIDYDRTHTSDYVHTLRCYWHFERNISQTCQWLHIHRNTLFYRLNKIADILQQDINSLRCFTDIHLSIEILVHLGELPPLDIKRME